MTELETAIEKQIGEVEELKRCTIYSFYGYGLPHIIVFGKLLYSYGQKPSPDNTQNMINAGYYKSIQDFDSYYTSDISFDDLYLGQDLEIYRERTLENLRELGETWRKRVAKEYPEARVWIVIHKENDEWYLDTFNYAVKFEDAIYL